MDTTRFRFPNSDNVPSGQSAHIYCVGLVTVAGVPATERGIFSRSYFVPSDVALTDFMDDDMLSEFNKVYPIGCCVGSVDSKTMARWYYQALLTDEERKNLGFTDDELKQLEEEGEAWE